MRIQLGMLLSLLFAFLLSGCAATGPSYTVAPPPQEGQALIYIYRPYSYALAGRDAYFYVDDKNVADLSTNGYTWFHAPAGQHKISQKWPIDISFKALEAPVTWAAGQTYYYRFVVTLSSNTFRWQFGEAPAELASQEIQQTKLQLAKPSDGAAQEK